MASVAKVAATSGRNPGPSNKGSDQRGGSGRKDDDQETGIDRSMRLAGSSTSDSGLVVLTYEPAGELAFDSIEQTSP